MQTWAYINICIINKLGKLGIVTFERIQYYICQFQPYKSRTTGRARPPLYGHHYKKYRASPDGIFITPQNNDGPLSRTHRPEYILV